LNVCIVTVAELTLTKLVPPSNISYTATLTDNNGCTATHNFNVIVNPLPDPSFTQSDITGCNPKCIDFSIINPNPNYTYNWTMGTGADRTGPMFRYCYSKDGSYDIGVIATTNLGCKDTIYKPNHIIINLSPTAQFSISPESVTDIMSPYFEFGNLSKDGMTYFWSFGDSQTSTDENTEHSYISSGEYCIKLIATSSYNTGIPTCSDSIVNCVTINPLSVLYIPDAFTPNNDGINDAFRIIGDSNIKYITNVVIINSLNIGIANIDTMFSLNTTKNWSGKLIDNLTYEGNFSCTFNVVDKTNANYSFTGNSASYIKTTHANTLISNYANCKFEDQFDNASFTTPYLTNEIHFK
jgi:PKD repeat protein